MPMVFQLDENVKKLARLKVVGVGGAGGNAINRMVESGLIGVEFIAVNTDAMALEHNRAEIKVQIGSKLTSGLGAGANPQVGMASLQEDRDRMRSQLEGADMVFIAAGMGGGTGTGAAPVVAEIARELGILTVAVVTRPFLWEGPVREKNAVAGLEALRRSCDTMIVVPNQKLLSVIDRSTPLREAFRMADEILSSATRGISEIILKHGDIQVDFADVRSVMSHGGDALMGTGRASGENKATVAADRAIHSPLLDNVSIDGATGVLVNITGGEDLSLIEVSEAMNYIHEAVGSGTHSNIIFGTVVNPDMKDEISITVIATGFGGTGRPQMAAAKIAENIRKHAPAGLEPRPIAPEPRNFQTEIRTPSYNLFDAPVTPAIPERPRQPEDALPPTTKVPFGARTPPARPVPGQPVNSRQEEVKPAYYEAAELKKAGAASPFQRGRYNEAEPDIDYETPAFLRNQAD